MFQLSETLLIDVTGWKPWRDTGMIDLFILFLFLLGGRPSLTDNIYFVMRHVRGACEAGIIVLSPSAPPFVHVSVSQHLEFQN